MNSKFSIKGGYANNGGMPSEDIIKMKKSGNNNFQKSHLWCLNHLISNWNKCNLKSLFRVNSNFIINVWVI